MYKNFIFFIKKYLSNDLSKPLGRWRIENKYLQLNQKIDLANEDHCGPCGQYALTKIIKKEKKIKISNLKKE